MSTKLGSGYIDLTVHYRDALKEIRRAFNDLDDAEIDVDANTKGATANVGRWRATEEAKPVELRVDVDTKLASTQVRGLRRDLESLGRSDFLKLNFGAVGISALPALASGLAEVAAAMQQVSQAALAIPGGIAGAASSVGTLVFGLTGVADAYEALNKAADDQATSGREAAAQARAQQSASYGLRNAIVDEKQARDDVSQAVRDQRRELQDLDLQMRGGIVSEKRAVLEAQKARERLYSGDFSDYRDALLDVEEADLRVEEVRNRNVRTAEDLGEANAKGVEGSDRVVAANERLVRSQQGVVTAQGAVAAAAETTSAAQEAADLAMGKLSQNGQAFVQALMDVTGPVMTLRNLVQDNIFAGLDGELRKLAGTALPTFERGLGGIGDAWNRSFKEMFRLAGSSENLSILERIFGNTTQAQDILTGALEPLTTGLLTLTEAGSDALPRLADGFVGLADRFANFITAADKDGRLDKWINDGITAVGQLGETLLNLGKIFTGITSAAQGTLLGSLEKWTTQWANWVNSIEGQKALKDFFAEGRRIYEQWRPILEDLPGIFKSIYDAASSFSSAVATILSPITEVLKDFPHLTEVAAGALLVFQSARVLGAVGALTTKLTGLSRLLDTTLPDSAKKGVAGVNRSLAGLALVLPGVLNLIDQLDSGDGQTDPATAGSLIAGGALAGSRFGIPGAVIGATAGAAAAVTPTLINGAPGPDPNRALPQGYPAAPGTLGPGFRPGDRGGLTPRDPGYNPNGGVPEAAPSHRNDPNFTGAAYGLPSGTNTGGYGSSGPVFPDWVHALESIFGIKASTYAGHQESDRQEAGYAPNPNHLNRGIDWTGPVDALQKFADYLATIPTDLEQVIWQNPYTHQKTGIGGGQINPGYYPQSTYDVHGGNDPSNIHVHTRQSEAIPVPPWLQQQPRTFDNGGWWQDGVLGVNTTGQDELVLSPDHLQQLQQQGTDPNTLIHGNAQGAPPGPSPEQQKQIEQYQAQVGDPFWAGRSQGYIPAAAGNTSKAGTSFLSGLYGMGAEVINGLIDQAASAASSAAGMAASVFAPGSGGAASGLASAAIGMGTQAAKRGVQYGAEMLGILTDSVIEQLTPFGAPRILTTDPTGFMPQQLLSGAMSKMIPGIMGQQMPGQPGQPPQAGQPGLPPPGAEHQGTGAAPGVPNAPQGPGPAPGPGAPAGDDPLDFLKPILPVMPTIHDQGGWLPPGGIAINKTSYKEPVPVFNNEQWGHLSTIANNPVPDPDPSVGATYDYSTRIDNVTVKDVAELERQMEDRRRLNTMRHRGRPGI